jgi:hypothetical protein
MLPSRARKSHKKATPEGVAGRSYRLMKKRYVLTGGKAERPTTQSAARFTNVRVSRRSIHGDQYIALETVCKMFRLRVESDRHFKCDVADIWNCGEIGFHAR